MKKNKKKKVADPIQKKAMLSTFIMLFPSLLITMWISNMTFAFETGIAISSILLFFFQAVLVKNFVDGHYRLKEES